MSGPRRGSLAALLLLAVLALAPARPAGAILGEPAERARARAGQWYAGYGAEAPRVGADDAGTAVRECWTGPPAGWRLSTALQFAGELLPGEARRHVPERRSVSGSELHYEVPGGFRIVLRAIGDRIFRLEITAPDAGGGC